MKTSILWALNIALVPVALLGAVCALLFFTFLGGAAYLTEWIMEDE